MPIEPAVASPRTLEDALALLRSAPYRPIAGGTDLMVQLAAEIGEPPAQVLDLWRVEGLRGIAVRDGVLSIGALTTYAALRGSSIVRSTLPALAEAAAMIGAAQIQNRGTLGGNAVNASPAGDTLPILLATDSLLVVRSATRERSVATREFWPAYRKTALVADELLVRIDIPIPDGRQVRCRKV